MLPALALTNDDFHALLQACSGLPCAVRDQAIVSVGFKSGMTLSCLAGLDYSDVHEHDDRIEIVAPLKRKSVVTMTTLIYSGVPFFIIKKWLDRRGRFDGPLFCPMFHFEGNDARLTPHGTIGEIIIGLCNRSGLGGMSWIDISRPEGDLRPAVKRRQTGELKIDFDMMIDQCRNQRPPFGPRTACIVALARSGLSYAQMARIMLTDIAIDGAAVSINNVADITRTGRRSVSSVILDRPSSEIVANWLSSLPDCGDTLLRPVSKRGDILCKPMHRFNIQTCFTVRSAMASSVVYASRRNIQAQHALP